MKSPLAGFIGRTIAYTLVIGVTSWIAQYLWGELNLDQNDAFVAARQTVTPLIAASPLICAAIGTAARPLGIFGVFYVVGAVLTAPFALNAALH
jgi:hypothetical protein